MVAVEAVVKGELLDDQVRSSERSVTASYIEDEIRLADLNPAQYLTTSHFGMISFRRMESGATLARRWVINSLQAALAASRRTALTGPFGSPSAVTLQDKPRDYLRVRAHRLPTPGTEPAALRGSNSPRPGTTATRRTVQRSFRSRSTADS